MNGENMPDTLPALIERLKATALDKDGFPRMDSERACPVGLALEAAAALITERQRADGLAERVREWERLAQMEHDIATGHYEARKAAERALAIAELKNKASLANNLCPDHRDKQMGKPCLACTIETAERELAANKSIYDEDYVRNLERELAAARELMNVYNLGGWTDAVEPMKRALAAERELAAAREDAERKFNFISMKLSAYQTVIATLSADTFDLIHEKAKEIIEAARKG